MELIHGQLTAQHQIIMKLLQIHGITISSTSPGDKPPEIKLNYPPNIFNAEAFDNYTLTFNCSAEDKQGTNKGIKNISLYLTDYQNNNFNLNETITFSGTNQEETALFTKTLLIGNYTWNCLVYDNGNNFDWAANRTLKIKKKQNETIKNASCCCGLQVSAAPEIAGQNEKVLIAADVSNLLTGLAATPSEITDLNISIYKVDNNTYTTIIIDIPMTYLSDGLWYYEFYTKNNATGTYIASVKMLTNQTTPFIKEASSAFTIGEKISGLTIIGVSPDLINTNKTARLAAEIKYNGIAVDSSLISNASLVIEKINGSAQNYTPQIDDGIIYLDGAFNETGIYYLDWTAAYLMQTRTAREIIVIVDWEELLEDINETVNVELLNLIKENRQYLLELLTDMEFLQEFSEEEIFLITDSVNSMTKVIDYLEKGDITNEEAEQQFNQIRQDLEDQLGIKLTGSAIGITSADIKPSPFKNLGEKLKDWRSLLFFILLLMVSMTLIIILMLTRIIKTGYADKPIKQIKIKRKQPKTYEKRRYEILIDKIRQKLESRKSKPVEIQPKSIRIKEDYVNSLNQFLLNAVDKGCTKGDIKIMLINKGWSRSFVDNYCDKFFEENKEKFIKRKI
ncbi:hypothetical protein KY343_03305 [Candidatus Woesearchaeota archaeon]|nr:hypothetical protein [Candidatus Woesearchaeota archaeon]